MVVVTVVVTVLVVVTHKLGPRSSKASKREGRSKSPRGWMAGWQNRLFRALSLAR